MAQRSEEHTSELQSLTNLVCRLLLEKKKMTLPVATNSLTHPVGVRPGSKAASFRSLRFVGLRSRYNRAVADRYILFFFFFFNDPAPPEIYPLSPRDALPT